MSFRMSSSWKNMSGILGKWKHKKLSEEWGSGAKEPVQEGMTFYLEYLGSTFVENAKGEASTAEAIKKVIQLAKAGGNKLKKVAVTISPKGIQTREMPSEDVHIDVSIYRISYCSADATYDRVVAFIATNKNELMECHAFLCSKKRVAQAVALTISQAFNSAFELWKKSRQEQEEEKKENKTKSENHLPPLIDLSASGDVPITLPQPWTTFEDSQVDELFSQLGEQHLTDIDRNCWNERQ
ncbi:low density lipoprotein receptor adapter protein 1 [Galendromus occidentalis]|uniref:Low density lipoprotein receptor adapter protein 1 n=1 Tax=Galendromus occidentalis TaxID=34638 RepID=A0AAJ6VUP1_9ACAR|nr:low density lipoprotein receptor adapter protein 1 [Galendromus occidentalis]